MSLLMKSGPWHTLVRLALPYWRQFIIVALLALLGTAAELVEPLIYRVAINDIAGVFVRRASQSPLEPSAMAEPLVHLVADTTRDTLHLPSEPSRGEHLGNPEK